MSGEPATWHHGLMAEWWSHVNDDFRAHELDYYLGAVSRFGGPALDAGCGAGRVMVPLLDAGFEVDGCDQSADMVAACREKARSAGHDPRLLVQALHELDLGRRYRTVLVVGVFGLGSIRDRDVEALRRLHDHLEPGGVLLSGSRGALERSGRVGVLDGRREAVATGTVALRAAPPPRPDRRDLHAGEPHRRL